MFRFITIAAVLLTATLANVERSVAGAMFWTDQGNIYRSNRDGTSAVHIFTASNANGSAEWLDIDPLTGKLYFRGGIDADGGAGGVIRRMNFDGTGVEDVVTGLGFSAYGLALDVPNNLIYFGDHPNGIFTANLNGTNVQPLPGTNTGFDLLRHTHDIEVASSLSKVYYTNGEFTFFDRFSGIRRADLDGTNVENVFDNQKQDNTSFLLALDEQAGRVYWSVEKQGVIWRANLDGSSPELFLSGITGIYDLEIDSAEGKLYFTSQDFLGRVNLDGTGMEQLATLSGTRFGKGLVLSSTPTPVPEPSSIVLLLIGTLICGCVYRSRQKHTHRPHSVED